MLSSNGAAQVIVLNFFVQYIFLDGLAVDFWGKFENQFFGPKGLLE
jgi:hypothetical protein